MAEEETSDAAEADEPKPKSRKGLMVGLVLALLAGAGGFYAVWSGMILAPQTAHEETAEAAPDPALPDVVYVEVPPLLVNVGAQEGERFLRFRAELEVPRAAQDEVTRILPRIVDVLNGYLRAVDLSELQARAALVKLRAQMLRRIQVVAGPGRVRDLLVMEFVLS